MFMALNERKSMIIIIIINDVGNHRYAIIILEVQQVFKDYQL